MKILIVQLGFIGDVILSTPVITALAELYPLASVSVLTTPVAQELLRFDRRLAKVHVYDKRGRQSGVSGLLEMGKELRSEKYDVVFSLHKSARTSLLLKLAGIPRRYGFRRAALNFLYTVASERDDLFHEVLRNLAVLRSVGYKPEEDFAPQMFLALSPEACDKADEIWGVVPVEKRIVLAPGSVWETKRWSAEQFARLGEILLDRGFTLALVGGPADRQAGETILEHLQQRTDFQRSDSDRVKNLIGTLTLLESAAIIDRSSALVSNDSAPLHIASALQVPVVGVFCATIPEFGFGPWKTPHRTIGLYELSCRPCRAHGSRICPTGTAKCMNELSAEAVFAQLDELFTQLRSNQ
ncbi:MAG: lipopolysaccharide heptosyltransferase II [bacterium]|nr:lipopolysaccharide heptosyltransferase II [bacterium]